MHFECENEWCDMGHCGPLRREWWPEGPHYTFLLGPRDRDWLGVSRQLRIKAWNRQLYPEWTESQGPHCWRGRNLAISGEGMVGMGWGEERSKDWVECWLRRQKGKRHMGRGSQGVPANAAALSRWPGISEGQQWWAYTAWGKHLLLYCPALPWKPKGVVRWAGHLGQQHHH